MGESHDQTAEEKAERNESGQRRTRKEKPSQGWEYNSVLPEDRRVKSSDPNLPHGWRPKPADPAGDEGAPAPGRARPVRIIRRGGGGAGVATTPLVILSNNVCGYNCKKASVPAIIENLRPDVCTWQETGLSGNNQIKIKGYHASVRNRKNFKKMGGVCTAVINSLKPHTVKAQLSIKACPNT